MASITFVQAGQTIHVQLTDSVITFGRDPSLNFGLYPPLNVILRDVAVSRQHARVFRGEDTWQLQDLWSTGGTYINQMRVIPEKPVPLSHGDSIAIGPFRLRYENIDEQFSRRPNEHLPGFEIQDDRHSSIQKSVRTSGDGLIDVRPQEELNGIQKINEALAGNLDLHAICPRILDALFEIFPQADRGVILFLHRAENDLEPVAQRHRRSDDSQPVRISRTILRELLSKNSAILSTNPPFDPQFADSESVAAQAIQSTMCVPMLGVTGKPFGVISLDSLDPGKQFSTDDLQLIVALANQASHAFDNARLLTVYMEKRKQDHEQGIYAAVSRVLMQVAVSEPPE